jgi:hypothetical protein
MCSVILEEIGRLRVPEMCFAVTARRGEMILLSRRIEVIIDNVAYITTNHLWTERINKHGRF